jgi:hypothetical protein
VVRASVGLFFDRIPLRATSNALQRDGSKYQVAVLSNGQAGAPVFPSVLTTKPTGFVPSITTIDPGIENGRARQASLQVERQIARETSVALAYLHLRGSGTIDGLAGLTVTRSVGALFSLAELLFVSPV